MIDLRALPCAVAALMACVPGDADGVRPTSRVDSAGIAIVTTDWRSDGPIWRRIEASPLVVVGADESDERTMLAGVTAAAFLRDGGVVIANSMSHRVHMHDEHGTLVRILGGSGEGPGEFRNVSMLWRLGDDTVAAFDRRLFRVVMFDGRGGLVRSVTPAPVPDDAGTPIHAVLGIFQDGTMLARSSRMPDGLSTGRVRASDVLYRVSASGDSLRVLGTHPGQELHVARVEGGRRSVSVEPFGRNAFYAVRGMRYWVLDSNLPEARRHAADGRLEAITRWSRVPVAVSESHVARFAEEGLDRWPPDQRERALLERRSTATHATLPAVSDMLVDDEERLWVRRHDSGDSTDGWWDVHAEDGARLGVVPMEPSWRLLAAARDRILVLRRDALDRERVQVHRLVAP